MRQTEDELWLARHGLAEAHPTPLLAARLDVRRRAKLADSVLLAVFLLGAALARVLGQLVVLTVLVVALLVGQWLVGRWVRRVDQRVGAELPRRVAHPVKLGWSDVLGLPYAIFTVASYAGAFLLAASVLPVDDSELRYGAIVVLISLVGAGAGLVLQLRYLLASPAVAEDEASLMADIVMRVEDARTLVTPSLVWSLPAILLYGESLGWWNAISVVLVVAGVLALALIHTRTGGVGAAARRVMEAR
ncbi:hypothetical protein [Cryptosporangium sp. NPDC048952]|uniref:hypothetical protein n=1 Tax=Cryptosporangium sp. NPDC048952 TaxID=3363961 RepID=UPI00371B650F